MNPLIDFPSTPHEALAFDRIKPELFLPALEHWIQVAKERQAVIVANAEAPTFENTVAALEFSSLELNKVSSCFFNLNSAETSDPIQEIAREFSPKLTAFSSETLLNEPLPPTVRTYIHEPGTIGNTHFLAIPFNASARAGAQVWINLRLGVEAQADKASPSVWGDPTVIDVRRLQGADQGRFEALELGPATLTEAELGTPLAEPHASWVEPLEAAWKSRYFGQAQ